MEHKKFCTEYDKVDGKQRRRYKRVAPDTYIYINNFNTESNNSFQISQCRLVNVSANGLVFNVDMDFREEDFVQTIFKLDDKVFNLKSKIVRKYSDSKDGFNYGVEFHVIKDSVRHSLSRCVNRYLKERPV